MSDFKRGLRPAAFDALRRLAEEAGQNWWKDLLTLWRPSGSAAGQHGLRLAVRDNYLNFYSRGQSIARVGFTPACTPYVGTHVKYIFGHDEKIQDYARLEGTVIRHRRTGRELRYEGQSTLLEWIKRAAEHKGIEKTCVDDLVTSSPSIIDLEMGLPADGARKTALRMDCVALEQDGDVIRIVFWEAKMIDDSRLRSTSEPGIVDQFEHYRDYLSGSDRVRSVVENAYRTVCRLLDEMRAMAATFGKEPKLDPSISRAAREGANLKVDPQPRLVIFGGAAYQKKGNWSFHEERLGKSYGIPYLILQNEPYVLGRPERRA